MSNALDEYKINEEKYWQSFCPKTSSKFICNITDSVSGEVVIPCYVIHTVERPTYHWVDNKRVWNDLAIECYETLGDNILMKINSAKTFNVRVKEFRADGVVAEEWELVDCRFENVYPEPLSWIGGDGDFLSVRCKINFTSIGVNNNIKGK